MDSEILNILFEIKKDVSDIKIAQARLPCEAANNRIKRLESDIPVNLTCKTKEIRLKRIEKIVYSAVTLILVSFIVSLVSIVYDKNSISNIANNKIASITEITRQNKTYISKKPNKS